MNLGKKEALMISQDEGYLLCDREANSITTPIAKEIHERGNQLFSFFRIRTVAIAIGIHDQRMIRDPDS
jgi:hypothetical protein